MKALLTTDPIREHFANHVTIWGIILFLAVEWDTVHTQQVCHRRYLRRNQASHGCEGRIDCQHHEQIPGQRWVRKIQIGQQVKKRNQWIQETDMKESTVNSKGSGDFQGN